MNETKFIKMVPSIKSVGGEDSRVLRFVGSTEAPDRSEDVIEVSGWDVGNYLKNPIVLWAHDYSKPPVGRAKSVYIDEREKALVFDVEFPSVQMLSSDPANPSEHALFVDTVFRMCKAGILNAVSVGFKGVEASARDDQSDKPTYARGLRIKKQELLELSIVPVPANPEALVVARSFGAVAEKMFEEKKEENIVAENISELEAKKKELESSIASLEAELKGLTEEKANRRLSKASMARIDACNDHMAKAMEELKALVSDGVVEDDTPASDGVERAAEVTTKSIDLSASVEEMNEYLRNLAETSKE